MILSKLYIFCYKKLRVWAVTWAGTESFLKLSDFQYSDVLMSFFKGSIKIFMFTT